MTKQEVYDFLKARKIWHEITEHPPVYDMAGLAQIPIPYPEADAKNLFVRDDKKRDYYLITVKGDKRVDLKEFRRNNQTRALSFATAQELMSILGLPPGSVTPLGLLHDPTGKVHFYIGRRFFGAPGPDRRTSQRQHGHLAYAPVRSAGAVRRSWCALSVRRYGCGSHAIKTCRFGALLGAARHGGVSSGRLQSSSALSMELRRWL